MKTKRIPAKPVGTTGPSAKPGKRTTKSYREAHGISATRKKMNLQVDPDSDWHETDRELYGDIC